MVFNQYPDIAKNVFLKPTLKEYLSIDSEIARYVDSLIGEGINVVDELIKAAGEKFSGTIDKRIFKYFGRLSPDNVSLKYKDFAQKCLENQRNYVKMEDNDGAYRNQFIEKDAYSIQKLVLKILDWYKL